MYFHKQAVTELFREGLNQLEVPAAPTAPCLYCINHGCVKPQCVSLLYKYSALCFHAGRILCRGTSVAVLVVQVVCACAGAVCVGGGGGEGKEWTQGGMYALYLCVKAVAEARGHAHAFKVP